MSGIYLATEYKSATGDNIWQFITVAFIFIFVLILTAFTTKWIAGYKKIQGHNKNIEAIETYRLTNNKWIQILKIGTRYVAISIGKDEIHMLLELEEDDLIVNERVSANNFPSILDKLLEKKKRTDETKEEFKDEQF